MPTVRVRNPSPLPFVWTFLLVLATYLVGASVQADERAGIERRLKATYEGKIVTLRNFYRGKRLHYNINGDLLKGGKPGPWTLYGRIEVSKITLHPDQLEVRGNRLFLIYDQEQEEFRHLRSGETVAIEIEVEPDMKAEENLQQKLATVFLGRSERLASVAPPQWRHFLAGETEQTCASEELEKISKAAEARAKIPYGIARARCRSCPAPQYPDIARRAGLEGQVLMHGIISRDGKVEQLKIIEPLGLGLDDAAVDAVSRWKYKPTLLDDQPVAVCTTFAVTFQLK